MTPAERYRVMSLEFTARAAIEIDEPLRNEWNHLATAYSRLAEQADKNAETDVVYEWIPKPPAG